jgi:hypothetical protein
VEHEDEGEIDREEGRVERDRRRDEEHPERDLGGAMRLGPLGERDLGARERESATRSGMSGSGPSIP